MTTEWTTQQRILLKAQVDKLLDKRYHEAEDLGRAMTSVKMTRTQLRALEVIVSNATRTSDLKNYIKNQTGKDRQRRTPQSWAQGDLTSVGKQMMDLLEPLAKQSTGLVQGIGFSPETAGEVARIVELELQRGMIHAAVCTAMYEEVEWKSGSEKPTPSKPGNREGKV